LRATEHRYMARHKEATQAAAGSVSHRMRATSRAR
jgi:hypothetical protein